MYIYKPILKLKKCVYIGVRLVNGALVPFREVHDFYEFRAGRLSRDSRDVFQVKFVYSFLKKINF
jgi:hypothetical protein